ncbi:hypothetical protein E1J38_002370 [Seonamhaeicola sediminis]|uniref:MotA/TolQ/ExbB proton channel domain-containing protein n=1 Tax=Seonamhaeicola sediminis TaxID=2528206 RepID=A0A562YIC2_9FLAO|nr:hypothetical protein [Seonamhaeicola sediminis]TWO34724.1 hypothetical protein E1J38_002370 [Seonamhaeicola sediminis]
MEFFLGLELYMLIVFGLLFLWIVFSTYYVFRAYNKGVEKVIPYVYDSIPSVFTTIGVLGTFIGIYFGLREFDVENITESIPPLLEGLKTAFTTSILGVSLSLIFGKVSQVVLRYSEKKMPPKPTGELAAFQEIIEVLKNSQKDMNNNFEILHSSIVDESEYSLSTQITKLRNQFTDLEKISSQQNEVLTKVHNSLGGDGETSLLTQFQKLRAEQNDYSKKQEKNVDLIVESMYTNNELIRQKFDEFSDLLAKNNTEALVEVMKRATEQFNEQMSSLIEKLVQENFKELNNSVQRMNDWQIENKEMIGELTNQFKGVSENFAIASVSINEITENTTKLTDENSHLTKLIEELQKVMIEDTKYQEITSQLTSAINTLKDNTEAFDETTNKLNDWVRNQMNFSDSVAVLLSRLEEIDKIKDINEVFWDGTKKQLNEGVAVVERASKRLSNDLESINDEFYARLNDTLQNLDTLIQRIIANYN